MQYADVPDNGEIIIAEFRRRFYDTELFFDPFVKGKFAHYLFDAFEKRDTPKSLDRAMELIEEAGLFIEAAHACYAHIAKTATPLTPFGRLSNRPVQTAG
jgi:sulfite reductase (ferredoxin)